jgi:hypothetical protein
MGRGERGHDGEKCVTIEVKRQNRLGYGEEGRAGGIERDEEEERK